jgi:hypothetical protein
MAAAGAAANAADGVVGSACIKAGGPSQSGIFGPTAKK